MPGGKDYGLPKNVTLRMQIEAITETAG